MAKRILKQPLITSEYLQASQSIVIGHPGGDYASANGIVFSDGTIQTTAGIATASVGNFVTTSSFNSFTSSINSFTSSYNTGSFTGSFTGSLQGTATTASYIAPNNALLSGLSYTVYANTSALTVPNDTNANTVATITIPSSSIRVGSMIRVNSLSSIGTIAVASPQCLTTQSALIDTSGFFYDSAIRQSTLYPNIMIKVTSTTTLRSFPTIRTVFQGPTATAIITKTIPDITTNDINLYLNVQKGGSAYAFSQEMLNVEVIY